MSVGPVVPVNIASSLYTHNMRGLVTLGLLLYPVQTATTREHYAGCKQLHRQAYRPIAAVVRVVHMFRIITNCQKWIFRIYYFT